MRPLIITSILFLLLSAIPIVQDPDHASGSPPAREVIFQDVAPDSFDDLSRVNFISAGDWNNDGYVDLLFNGYRLYRNSGPPGWDFTYQGSVFNSSVSGAVNGVWADWDGDGDLDLYQGCGKGTADRFWENQGAPDHLLVDRSREVFGTWENLGPNTGNAWGDIDRDGDLDLYVCSGEDWNDGNPIYYPDFLLKNENGAYFTDISLSSGIRTGEDLYSRGATFGDYNNDRWHDIYVSHYRIRENHLFENQRDGSFDEVGEERNCSGTFDETWYYDSTAGSVYGKYWWGPTYGHTIGSSWADFNRDGNLDIWTSDFVHKYVGYINDWYDIRGYVCDDANLYINDGAPHFTFTDYRNSSGIPIWPIGGRGTFQGDQTFSGITIGDYDNDGWEDMYIPQVYGHLPYTTPHLFRNKGAVLDGSVPNGTTFEDVTDGLGIKGANTYANLFIDYDNDGDLDLVTSGAETWDGSNWQDYRIRLYRNQGTGANHFLRFQLNGTGMNPQAVGARVVLRIDDDVMMTREVRAGTGHAHQGSNVLHFGLGDRDLLPRSITAEVIWPDGVIHPIDVAGTDRTIYVDRWSGEGPEAVSWQYTPSQIEEDSSITVTAEFSSSDSMITKYLWDTDMDNRFDMSTDKNSIQLAYHEDGVKHIRCRAIDENILGREMYPMVIEVPNKPPVIDIQDMAVLMDDPVRLGPDMVDDTRSDLRNLSWKVDWGDGSIDNGTGNLEVSHVYTEPGTMSLTVEADDGTDITMETATVLVNNVAPWGWIEVKGGNSSTFDEDHRIRFFPHIFDTPSDGSSFRVQWDFGDGSGLTDPTSVSDLVHSYEEKGEYDVMVLAHDDLGGTGTLNRTISIENKIPGLLLGDPSNAEVSVMEDQLLEFDGLLIPDDTASDLPDLEFRWEFGDASRTQWRSTLDTDHIYDRSGTYHAVCSVRDDDGDQGNQTIVVVVENPVPVMGDIHQFREVWEDQEFRIEFDARDNPSDQQSLSFHVDLGDGRVLEAASGVQVSYPKSGDYDICITVEDDDGATDSRCVPITVKNRPPTGEIHASSVSVDEDEMVSFRASSVRDSSEDLDNITAVWRMKDGSGELHGMFVEHVFVDRGKYDVELVLSDGDDTTVITRTITVNNPLPTAEFSFRPAFPAPGVPVIFDASNSTDNPSDVDDLSFYWDTGDGGSGEGKTLEHTYSEAGTYRVLLEVLDDDMANSFFELEVMVEGVEGDTEEEEGGGISLLLIILIAGPLLVVLALVLLAGLIMIRRRRASAAPPRTSTSGDHQGELPSSGTPEGGPAYGPDTQGRMKGPGI